MNPIILDSAIICMLFMNTLCLAQSEDKKHRTFINIDFNQSETHKKIIATLTARIEGERGRKRVEDAAIEFYAIYDTTKILLGIANTNIEGMAMLEIGKDQNIVSGPENGYTFSAFYKGDEDYAKVSNSRSFNPVKMNISFAEIDSVKNIVVTAYQIDKTGNEIPVNAIVKFYIPGQFSMLEIGRERLQEGKATVKFPETLPGDSIGNLKIIAKIENSKKYGAVEAINIKNWGKPRPSVVIEKRRGLGDTDAPLWMVYTLIFLLSAVWFHYMYIIYVFVTIKRKGKDPGLV